MSRFSMQHGKLFCKCCIDATSLCIAMHRAHGDFLFDVTITTRATDFTGVLSSFIDMGWTSIGCGYIIAIIINYKDSQEYRSGTMSHGHCQLIHQSMAQTTHAEVQAAYSEARQALEDAREREKAVPEHDTFLGPP